MMNPVLPLFTGNASKLIDERSSIFSLYACFNSLVGVLCWTLLKLECFGFIKMKVYCAIIGCKLLDRTLSFLNVIRVLVLLLFYGV